MPPIPMPARRMLISTGTLFLCAVGSLLVPGTRADAQVSTWSANATTWENPNSWVPTGVPGPTATAQFTNVPTGPLGGNVFLAVNEQIGQILFASNARAFNFFGDGTLTINAPTGTGIVNSSTQPQEFAGNSQYILGASQTWNATGDLIFDQPIVGPAFVLTKTGPGTLNLTANATLSVTTFNAVGGRTIFDSPAGLFTYAGGQLNVGTGGTATLQLGGDINNRNNAIDAANVAIAIGPTGTLTSGANTVHNLGAVTITGGTISGDAVGTGPNFTFVNGSTVLVNGTATSNITPPRGIQLTAGAGTVTFNVGNGVSGSSANPDLTVSALISGAGALNKTGTGVMRLSAANTYTGATNINAGTIQLSSPGRTGSGTVTNSGVLSGNGTIGGQLNTLSGGIVLPIDPATNGPGRLTQTSGNTDFASGSTLAARIGGNANDDASRSQFQTNGALTFPNSGGGTWTVDVSKVPTFTPTAGARTYTIAQAGSIPSTGLDIPVTLTATGAGPQFATNGTTTLRVTGFFSGDMFSLQRQGNSIALTYTPVPEPVGLLAICGAGVVVASWRRQLAAGRYRHAN